MNHALRHRLPHVALLFVLSLTIVAAQVPPAVDRGPYLQLGTHDGATVCWRTDQLSASEVKVRPAGSTSWTVFSDAGLVLDHAVAVTGLAAESAYEYEIGDGALVFSTSPETFRTAPSSGARRPTRLWVIGDSGTADSDARSVRDAYYELAGARHTDVWLMLGDNAYSSGTDAEYQAAVFENMYEDLLPSTYLWSTFGNHDAITADASTQSGAYYDIFHLPSGGEIGGLPSGTEAYYSFDHANIHFVCLDSSESDRSVGGAMLTWLQADLASTSQEWIIAFWHHPPYSHGSHDSDLELALIEMRTNALPFLEAAGVDLVLCGHSHAYERSFLLDGHYDLSSTFDPLVHAKDSGDGNVGGDGAYRKPDAPLSPNDGAVYVVAGSLGKATGGPLDHQAMFVSLNLLGSMVIDVDGLQLDARFLHPTGVVLDHFTMVKGGVTPLQRIHTALPPFSTWSFEDTGTDLGSAWQGTAFDDSSWSQGPAPLGYGESWVATTVSFGPDPLAKQPTTYFRNSFDLDVDPSLVTDLQMLAVWDDGFVCYLNGVEVARRNMPPGPPSYGTQAASVVEADTYELVSLRDHVGQLVSGTNVLAVEIHQANASSSDVVWDATLAYEALIPLLGPCAAGTIGTGAGAPVEEILLVNGESGGIARSMDLDAFQPVTISIAQPSTNPNPANFAVFGMFGTPTPADTWAFSTAGTMCFPPPIPGISGDPFWTLTVNGAVISDALIPSTPAPWQLSLPGGLFPGLEMTLQGLILDTPSTIRVTNAVRVFIRP